VGLSLGDKSNCDLGEIKMDASARLKRSRDTTTPIRCEYIPILSTIAFSAVFSNELAD